MFSYLTFEDVSQLLMFRSVYLKNLKDGEAISLKYDSKTLSFKTPTKVIIFSNTWADRKKMLLDRWKYSTLNKMS